MPVRLVEESGEGTTKGKNPRRSPKARRERVKIEAIAALLDNVKERADSGLIRIFDRRPVELRYFDRREDNPIVMCSGTPNNWAVRGWHVDVTQMDAYELVRELTRKQSAAVYRMQEVTLEGSVVKNILIRTWVVFHAKAGYAIVAETFKVARPQT